MKKQTFIGGGNCPIYAAPTIETIEFSAEQGFAASPYDEIFPGNGDGTLDDPNNYDYFF